jgi:hypothetical protein
MSITFKSHMIRITCRCTKCGHRAARYPRCAVCDVNCPVGFCDKRMGRCIRCGAVVAEIVTDQNVDQFRMLDQDKLVEAGPGIRRKLARMPVQPDQPFADELGEGAVRSLCAAAGLSCYHTAIMVLIYVQGCSLKEVGRIAGKSAGRIQQIHSHSLRRFMSWMQRNKKSLDQWL